MREKITVLWNIDTGYANNNPDWELSIDPSDFEGMTDEEIEEALFEEVREEMDQQISEDITNLDDVIAQIRASNDEER